MRRWTAGSAGFSGVVFCTVVAVSQPALADAPRREGFTLEVGLGMSLTTLAPDVGESETRFGLAPLSLSLGGFLTPDVAMMARIAGTSYFEEFGGDTVQLGSNFYGLALQYWPADVVFIGGGFGFALFDDNPFFGGGNRIAGEGGWALMARAGWSFATLRDHSFALVYELIPAFYDGFNVFGHALIVQYQML
jgi:hypothetical protein